MSEERTNCIEPSCSRMWHDEECGSKKFYYWIPSKGRYSYATPRTEWKPDHIDAHCTRCGKFLKENVKSSRCEPDGSIVQLVIGRIGG